jgi:general secretion pathway protein K
LVAKPQRGMVLLVVVWIIALLAVTVGSFVVIARTESAMARFAFDNARARMAAEAGVAIAVMNLKQTDLTKRWMGDGRENPADFDGAKLKIQLFDESGKIDLNTADQITLTQLLRNNGIEQPEEKAAAIMDWRDPDDLLTPGGAEKGDYSAERSYPCKNAPFDTIEELQQVMGFDFELYQLLEPALTIFTARGGINAAVATPQALVSLPGMTQAVAQQYAQARLSVQQPGMALPPLPDGSVPVADVSSMTYTIRSSATLERGAKATIEATVRIGASTTGRPFQILRWKDLVPNAAATANGNSPAAPASNAPAAPPTKS